MCYSTGYQAGYITRVCMYICKVTKLSPDIKLVGHVGACSRGGRECVDQLQSVRGDEVMVSSIAEDLKETLKNGPGGVPGGWW